MKQVNLKRIDEFRVKSHAKMDKMRNKIEEKNVDKIANEKDMVQKTHFLSKANILYK